MDKMDVDSPGTKAAKESPFQQFCLTSLSPINPFSPPQFAQPMDISPAASPFVPIDTTTNRPDVLAAIVPRGRDLGVMKTASCKCRKTQCLQKYCPCFARQEYCGGCGCTDCKNTHATEEVRAEAIRETLERNPDAFTPSEDMDSRGCNCRNSNCKKKYCSCFEIGLVCTSLCRCQSCLNR